MGKGQSESYQTHCTSCVSFVSLFVCMFAVVQVAYLTAMTILKFQKQGRASQSMCVCCKRNAVAIYHAN